MGWAGSLTTSMYGENHSVRVKPAHLATRVMVEPLPLNYAMLVSTEPAAALLKQRHAITHDQD